MAVRVGINEKALINNNTTVSQIVYGISWEETNSMPSDMIVDMMMFGLNENDECVDNKDVYFFHNPELSTERDVIIKHQVKKDLVADNGRKEPDMEQMFLLLDELPKRFKKIVFTLAVYDEEGKDTSEHYLSQIGQIQPHIFNYETNETIVSHEKYGPDFFLRETCIILGSLERDSEGTWSYTNISQAFLGNMGTLLAIYLEKRGEEEY